MKVARRELLVSVGCESQVLRRYLIEDSRLRVVVVIVRIVSCRHARFERGVFDVTRAIGDLRPVECVAVVVRAATYEGYWSCAFRDRGRRRTHLGCVRLAWHRRVGTCRL